MRITESRLRRIIRELIKENVNGSSVYPFRVELDTTFGDERYSDLRHNRKEKINNFDELCVKIAGCAESISFYLSETRYDHSMTEEEKIEKIFSHFYVEGLEELQSNKVKEALHALLKKQKTDPYFAGRAGELMDGYQHMISEPSVGGEKFVKFVSKICTKELGF